MRSRSGGGAIVTMRVMIVEDQAMLRESLAMAINAQEDMQVAGVLADAAEALDLVERIHPDLVLRRQIGRASCRERV